MKCHVFWGRCLANKISVFLIRIITYTPKITPQPQQAYKIISLWKITSVISSKDFNSTALVTHRKVSASRKQSETKHFSVIFKSCKINIGWILKLPSFNTFLRVRERDVLPRFSYCVYTVSALQLTATGNTIFVYLFNIIVRLWLLIQLLLVY